MKWSTACPDWRERIVKRGSLIPFAPLFPEEAAAALEVFKSLRLVDVAGQPTFGEACEDYVFDFVAAVFGAYDHENARRMIEEFFLLVSKKNIKSTLAAGIMLTALIRNWRHSAELLIVAPTLEIANNSFVPAADMVRADQELSDLLTVQDNLRTIKHKVTNASLKVVSADSATVGGKKAAFVLVEELWLFGKRANAATMLQEATGGQIARPEGFTIYITTQADEPPKGVFKEKLEYFRDVRDGKITDPQSLPVLYEFPEDMIEDESYLDPANFYVTNPNIGRSVRQDWLERKLNSVRSGTDEDGDDVQTFLAKHLNVQIGGRRRRDRWAGVDFWDEAADQNLSALPHWDALWAMIDRCEVVVGGADGGGLDDLFGLSFVGREKTEIEVVVDIDGTTSVQRIKRWLCWSHAWCDKSVTTRRKSIATTLSDIEKSGELTMVTDGLSDLGGIVGVIKKVKGTGKLAAFAVDPWSIGELVDALADSEIDITADNGMLIGVRQGSAMMSAIKTTERRLKSKTFLHCGGPLMSWCVPNLKIEPTATGIRATKQNAVVDKIDPAMAMFDAVTVMVTNPEAAGNKTSFWEAA